MSFRQPAFMVVNYMDGLAAANITSTLSSSAMERSLIDKRQGTLAVFPSSAANHFVRFRFGVGTIVEVRHVVIPAGHNMGGIELDFFKDEDDFSTPTTLNSHTVPAGSGVIDAPVDAHTGEEAFQVNLDGTGQWELSEIWLGVKTTLSAEAFTQPKYESEPFGLVSEVVYPAGLARTLLAPSRRRFSLGVRNVATGTADHTILESVLDVGLGEPFWYWPPDDSEPGPYLVQLTRGQRFQESKTPSVAPFYEFRFDFEESRL